MGKPNNAWKIEQVKRNVHNVRCSTTSSKWEQWVLLQADEHWDNSECRLDLLERDHKEALKRNAIILKFGDTFCAMNGKFDKRSDKGSVRPEHQDGDYLDSLVRTAAEWYAPYATHIGIIGIGNHESAIRNRHETDLTERLAERLRQVKGGIATPGGYTGWVRFQISRSGGARSSLRLWYAHGSGGGGPITKGAIDYNRYAEYTDADVIVSGHIHRKMHVPVKRLRLSDGNVQRTDTMHYVRCASYKDDYKDGHSGWHVERGMGPRPLGGYWMRLHIDRADKNEHGVKVEFRDTEA